jgi:hypothetical protein
MKRLSPNSTKTGKVLITGAFLCLGVLYCSAWADDLFIFDPNIAPAPAAAPRPRRAPQLQPGPGARANAVQPLQLAPPAPRLIVGPQAANVVGQKGVEQQTVKMLEPLLKTELSFAIRAADLNADERQKLIANSKKWFDKYYHDFIKHQNPNQLQMFLQGGQGVWVGGQVGGQPPQYRNPREPIRAGIATVVASTVPKEKVAAYENECRKRAEFAHKVAVENVVARLDEKVNLSPDQWKRLTKSLSEHSDKSRDPQLEMFLINSNMLPGGIDQSVISELTPAQQVLLKRMSRQTNQVFWGGGIFGGMMAADGGVIDDVEIELDASGDDDDAPVENNPFR